MALSLSQFHPHIQAWFNARFDRMTDIQEKAWPLIASGSHVFITAPTGSGKTLTAFLWALNQLTGSVFSSGQTSVLYVSPLKALNADIQKNLNQPLREIKQRFNSAGDLFPNIQVLTRSGDTPQADRRKMLRHPPEILITTPESLNLLLSSVSGREMLCTLKTVILDEIHSVMSNKRGVHLITAVERLVMLSGEFQRITLSATLKNVKAAAEFVGGFRLEGSLHQPRYIPRKIFNVRSSIKKEYRVRVGFNKTEAFLTPENDFWDSIAAELVKVISKNRATLVFTNNRRLCEKLTFKINTAAGAPVAYAHHGSLSRTLRQDVEHKLKHGHLKAIVATSSLEMGIDIGVLDEVVMIQLPPSISSAVQRAGRAGHHVGEITRVSLYPVHSNDLVQAAVLAKALKDQDIESLTFPGAPLDVLSQILVSMTGTETWDIDHLYNFIKTSFPYHHLSRQQYDLVLNMLAGRYGDTRIRELRPRISMDAQENTVIARRGALLDIYLSGGTIPDRGYFQLRHQQTHARLGELDEEYVWEAKIGQITTIGTQNWRIQKITHNDVMVLPAGNAALNAPFWKAESMNRDFHFSEKIAQFLELANANLKNPGFSETLKTDFYMESEAALNLMNLLKRQEKTTRVPLPHRHHIVLEYVRTGPGGHPGSMLVIHTLWGGKLNRPYALALEAAWKKRYLEKPITYPGNDAVVIQAPQPIPPEELINLVTAESIEILLREGLEGSTFFGARFRECAGRALLLSRTRFNQRMPLWMSRLRSQKLLESILSYGDFPILLETWRTCLQDEFDLFHLQQMLGEIETGRIQWSAVQTKTPSPFAAAMAWRQINQYMYQEDQPASSASALKKNLIQEILFSPQLRPAIPLEVIQGFEDKCQRLLPGYTPQSERELVDWVKERVVIPLKEWEKLLHLIKADAGPDAVPLPGKAKKKLVLMTGPALEEPLVVARELLAGIISQWYNNGPEFSFQGLNTESSKQSPRTIQKDDNNNDDAIGVSLFAQWLRFYGPRQPEIIRKTLGLTPRRFETLINSLTESQTLITGHLVQQEEATAVCDSENFEILLRLSKIQRVPVFEALDIQYLPLFLANHQNLTLQGSSIDDLFRSLEQLICLPLDAALWESEILPSRIEPYHCSMLDTLVLEENLGWIGFNKKKVGFCFKSDLDLMPPQLTVNKVDQGKTDKPSPLEKLFETPDVHYDFSTLLRLTSLDANTLSRKIWELVWTGQLCNTTFAAMRKGIETGFKPPKVLENSNRPPSGTRRISYRQGFSRWRGSLPLAGHWFCPAIPETEDDPMEAHEKNKDRVRILLNRYGILFREILVHEMQEFQWSSIFRSLRLMELAGEILGGYFFKGIQGPQFITPEGLQTLKNGLPEKSIFRINAMDPVSLLGFYFSRLFPDLPKRLPGNHLVYRGIAPVLISQRSGKQLTINIKVDDPDLLTCFGLLKHLLTRTFKPLRSITIDTINNEPASVSPYIEPMKAVFDVLVDFKKIVLYNKTDPE